MDRRTLATTAAVVLVLVAGCAGFGPGGSETADPTATPTSQSTTTPTPTSVPTDTAESDAARYPDGWSEAGIDDPNAALAAHYRAMLTGPPVTVTYRSRVLEATDENATNTTLEMAVVARDRELVATIDGSRTSREVYFADGTLTQWSVETETVANRSSAEFVRVAQSIDRGVLQSQLILYRLERNETVDRAGTTGIVYDVTGVQENAVSGTYGTATDASGRMVVSERGRVLEVETTVTYTGGRVAYHYEHTAIGETTVETPEWMEQS